MPYSKQLHILLYYNSEEGKKGRELPRTIEGDQTLIYTRTWVVEHLHHQALPGPFPFLCDAGYAGIFLSYFQSLIMNIHIQNPDGCNLSPP